MRYKGYSGWTADGLVFWGEADGQEYRFIVPGLGEWNASSFLEAVHDAPAVGQIVNFAHRVYTITEVEEKNSVITVLCDKEAA